MVVPTAVARRARSTTSARFAAAISPMGEPDAPALIDAKGTTTHDELRRMVSATAEELAGPRQLALIRTGRDLDTVVAYLGAMAAGHTVLLTSPGDDPRPGGIENTFAPGLRFDGDGAWRSTGAPQEDLHPDLALLMSTSGTTGSPKLVRLSASNVSSNAAAIAGYLRIGPDDRAMATLPLHYCYGLSVLNSHLHAGAAVVLTETSVVDPCFWDLAERTGATSFAGVPHTFTLLERRGSRPGRTGTDCIPASIRTVTQAGGRMDPEAVRRWAAIGAERGFDFVVMYGQTEATARMAWLPPELASQRPGAIGVPIPGGSFRLEPTEAGDELVYAGPNVMMGYALEPSDLARGAELAELHTGDLARQAPDGLWEITGRRNRFAKPMGLRVDLERLEDALAAVGLDAACVALTEPGGTGELVGVMVGGGQAVGHEDAGPDVRRTAATNAGLPVSAVFAAETVELPRNASGKVDLAAVGVELDELLRTSKADGSGGSHGHAPVEHDTCSHDTDGHDTGTNRQQAESATLAAMVAAYAASLPTGQIDPERSFVDLGGDSLSYVEVSMQLEEILGRLPADWHLRTIAELAEAGAVSSPSRLARVEIGGVLRTIGILMVVSRHVQLTTLGGGAHVLMALSGYNFSRFPLTAAMRDGNYRRLFTAVARVAVPTALWLAAVVAITGGYSWANVGFLNAVLGPDSWGDTWRYWYLEALVQILALMALAFCVPAVRRGASHLPFALPVLLTAAALTVRFGVLEFGHEHRQVNLATGVLWLFLAGWAAHRAETIPRRLLVSVIALVALPGWFDDPVREVIVAVALLGIIWLREVPVPRVLAPVIGVVGGASMWIYLTHWQVYPPLEDTVSPAVLLVLSILTGVLAQKGWDRLATGASTLWRRYRPRSSSDTRRSTRSEPVAETSSNSPLRSAGR